MRQSDFDGSIADIKKQKFGLHGSPPHGAEGFNPLIMLNRAAPGKRPDMAWPGHTHGIRHDIRAKHTA
ncbi:hypothetical protein Defa_29540 [Desulfovibrio sp. TH_2024_36128]|uniref:Uncharacterized protein n=1 Tax=Desulfovibrio falkowii TaxID=3136602 RepID=A0ABQ0ED47_9BACT